mmetsp:Transcript_86036/g.170798  ORF Transcript_86036/g.170798 Transcript_86036/m.170798 type:complete len:265 (+) Transcript_86036:125-919(+)
MLHREVGHGINMRLVLHIFDGLLDCSQGCMFALPFVHACVAANKLAEGSCDSFHGQGISQTINRLLSGMEQFILILVAFLIIHSCSPSLEFVYTLCHHRHAGLQRSLCKGRQVLLQPFLSLLEEGDNPLQRQAFQAFLKARTGVDDLNHEIGWLHDLLQLLLEEVWLYRSHLYQRFKGLLQEIRPFLRSQLPANLVDNTRRDKERCPIFLLHLYDQLANNQQRCNFNLYLWVSQPVLQHSTKLCFGSNNRLAHCGYQLPQQPHR